MVGKRYCCAVTCTNGRTKRPDLSFFRFPRDNLRCEIWTKYAGKEGLKDKTPEQLNRVSYLCADHFESDMFMNKQQRNKLVWNAIPTMPPTSSTRENVCDSDESIPPYLLVTVPGEDQASFQCLEMPAPSPFCFEATPHNSGIFTDPLRTTMTKRMNRYSMVLGRMERIERINLFGECRLRDWTNPLDYLSNEEFRKRYRFTKETVTTILNMIDCDLHAPISRGSGVPSFIQLLIALRFFVTGTYQKTIGNMDRVSQQTCGNIIRRVARALAKKRSELVQFPNYTTAPVIRHRFKSIAGFPGVTGTIGCTHIRILSPGGEKAAQFRNEKGVFSIKVQGVAGPDLQFLNIVSWGAGSSLCNEIFEKSVLRTQLESETAPGLLLGSNDYTVTPYLLTPVESPKTDPEAAYNQAHAITWNTVNQMFRVWKQRFHCLNSTLHTQLDTSIAVVIACSVLHNIAIQLGDQVPDEEEEFHVSLNNEEQKCGQTVRQAVIEQYFTEV